MKNDEDRTLEIELHSIGQVSEKQIFYERIKFEVNIVELFD